MNIIETEAERQTGYKTGEADIAKWVEKYGILDTIDLCDEKIVQLWDSAMVTDIEDPKVSPYVQGLSRSYEDFMRRHTKKIVGP